MHFHHPFPLADFLSSFLAVVAPLNTSSGSPLFAPPVVFAFGFGFAFVVVSLVVEVVVVVAFDLPHAPLVYSAVGGTNLFLFSVTYSVLV